MTTPHDDSPAGHDPAQAETLGETLLPATEPAAGSGPAQGDDGGPLDSSGEGTGSPASADPSPADVEDDDRGR